MRTYVTIAQIKKIHSTKKAIPGKIYYTNTDEAYMGNSDGSLRKMVTE